MRKTDKERTWRDKASQKVLQQGQWQSQQLKLGRKVNLLPNECSP